MVRSAASKCVIAFTKNTACTAILCDMASNNQLIADFFENFPNYPKVLVHNGLVLGDRSKACKYRRLIKSLDNNRVFSGGFDQPTGVCFEEESKLTA